MDGVTFLSVFILIGLQLASANQFSLERCVAEKEKRCRQKVATFNGIVAAFGKNKIQIPMEKCTDEAKNECNKFKAILHAFGFIRSKRYEDSDMERAVERCLERMRSNKMMMKMYSEEKMRAGCMNQMRWSQRVNEMDRNDDTDGSNRMSPGTRHYFTSLGKPQGQNGRHSQGQDVLSLRLKSQMQSGKDMCMGKMKKNDMMMKMFTTEQMDGVCGNQMKWVMKAEEAKRRDPSMTEMVGNMSKSMTDYFNSLGNENRQKRSTHASARPRKEYRMLTSQERQSFHDAVNAMKNTMVDGETNEYDVFVLYHLTEVSPGAHWGAAFPGWHREFLIRFERALQRHNPSVMIPYWDSSMDNRLGDLANRSIMWTEDFMGNAEGPVTTGPFANWETVRPTFGRDGLWRAGGTWANGSFYSDESVDYIISIDEFRNNTWHVNQFFEFAHGLPHLWVGGPMGDIENSPSEPIFFMHHAFVDMLWESQQQRVFSEGRRSDYVYPPPTDHEAYGVGENQITPDIVIQDPRDSFHFITNPMQPFEHFYNADGLRDTYRLFYHYAERPSCSRRNSTCGSPYLFCIDEIYKCAPKLQLGASCKEYDSSDSCFDGICENGVCSKIPKCG